jgi:HAD superfamily hydrolase (TIGR01549 family)
MENQFGIIFDCDGTLTDSLDHAMDSFHFAVQSMDAHHIKSSDIQQYFGIAADKILLKLMNNDKSKGKKAFDFFIDHQQTLANKTMLFEGILDLMDSLKALNIPLGMVTGRHSRDLHIMLQPHGLHQYFQVLVSDDLVESPKPNPEGIQKAANFLKIDPRNTMYLGDSPSDIEAAHRAGAISVAVTWDPHANQEALAAQNPHYMINHPSEIIRIYRECVEMKKSL